MTWTALPDDIGAARGAALGAFMQNHVNASLSRVDPFAGKLYETLRAAERDGKLDLSARLCGANHDWVWIAQVQPTEKQLVELSLTANPLGSDDVFDVLIGCGETRVTIYSLKYSEGMLWFDARYSFPNEMYDEGHFLDNVSSALEASRRRRKYPNPDDEPGTSDPD